MESKQEISNKNIIEQEKLVNSLDCKTSERTKQKKSKKIIRSLYGISFALLAAFCGGMIPIAVKGANFFSVSDIGFFRYTIQLITMLFIGLSTKTNLIGVKEIRKSLIFIGIFYVSTVLLVWLSVKLIKPSESTSLSSLNMIIIPIIARIYIKEKFHVINLISLVMAIFGVVFISQPSFLFDSNKTNSYFNLTNGSMHSLNDEKGLSRIIGITAAIGSALFSAFANTISKNIADKKVHFSLPCIYQSFFGIPFSLLLSAVLYFTGVQKYDMKLVKGSKNILFQILFAVGSSLFGVLFQIFLNVALKYEKSSRVSIILATSLLFTFIAQYLILNINANLFSTFGVLLIFFSTLSVIFFQMLEKLLLNKKKCNQNGDDNKKRKKNISSWKKCLFFKI